MVRSVKIWRVRKDFACTNLYLMGVCARAQDGWSKSMHVLCTSPSVPAHRFPQVACVPCNKDLSRRDVSNRLRIVDWF